MEDTACLGNCICLFWNHITIT